MTSIHADFDKRRYDGLGAGIAHSKVNTSIADILADLIDGHNAQRSGTDTVASGSATKVVAVGAAYDGKPLVVSLNEADGVIHVLHAVWDGSGSFTLTLSAVTTGIRTFSWIVDGRA